jgi:hypothetical protein
VHSLYCTQTDKVKAHTSIPQNLFRVIGIQLHSSTPYVHSTEITIVISWLDGGENLAPWPLSRPENTQLVGFDEHEHYFFKLFCKAPTTASAISPSTSILHNASNSNSNYFHEIFSEDDPRYSYVTHTSKVGNLSLRLQQSAMFDCCKAILIYIGSGRYPVSCSNIDQDYFRDVGFLVPSKHTWSWDGVLEWCRGSVLLFPLSPREKTSLGG